MNNSEKNRYVERFDAFSRLLHILVIISFLLLAITGMTIKFSDVWLFQFLSSLLGGYTVTGYIHRFAAIITFVYFFAHIYYLIRKKRRERLKIKDILSGENSLVPNKQDFKDFVHTMKWFFGVGKRPDYGKWTYWEKFDYFAVFWGVLVIGSSGLILWFPEFFTELGLPGSFINIATIIHSDEALLATGFIFSVHFFNTHFRPDKFPMDPVIFTGRVSVEEMKYDRPREYEMMEKSGELQNKLIEAPSPALLKVARAFGLTALTTGLIIVVMIIYTMIFVYQ
ncbi:MAG: cytochrome b/b6 domain-containing protein [Melioribacteraceae bacterium]|nr:cytochrome b/b6 domain-containing protein [Melioribacteraceae bacterium]MCF8356161.1 cytochrome b/b6 domain-containing protein [Melioribacteraceae bacterium]MCF8392327.1 cytochrome b/b6 domain-containing protein [Melioribacteraceae bacterium]MCF8417659.1 cytochrome b/b6 domain-containing protein [Melioribacteraceae bacterium]